MDASINDGLGDELPEALPDELRELLDGAVAAEATADVVERIRSGLCALIRAGAVPVTERLLRPETGTYARRLLHRDPDRGYSVVAMTWGPGQGTPLHDHAGLWCVEGVLHGEIAVTRFDLIERDGARYRFREAGREDAGVGSAGCLIPPSEYHMIENADPESVAVTLHVYGGDMDHCNAYRGEGDGWYWREAVAMGFCD